MRNAIAVAVVAGLVTGCGDALFGADLMVRISAKELGDETFASVVRYDLHIIAGELPDRSPLECAPFESGELEVDDPGVDLVYSAELRPSGPCTEGGCPLEVAPPPIGDLEEGRILVLARAWDADCRVVGSACLPIMLLRGQDRVVELQLCDHADSDAECFASEVVPRCREGQSCVDGACL
jgi:hypothetical protein